MPFNKLAFAISISSILYCCKTNTGNLQEKSKQEIGQAEKEFEKMASEKGIAEAFYFFADSNATIKRQNDTLIKGKDNIRNYYSAEFFKKASVTWSPDFIDVAKNGDLGYTFGKYIWQSKGVGFRP